MALFMQKPWYRTGGGSAKIYGAKWAGTATTHWSRTDSSFGLADPSPALSGGTGSSPYDDIMPWKGMVIEEDANAGTMVKIPKFYYKWTMSGTEIKLQISEQEFDGSSVSPAHQDRGDGVGERDYVYIARYHTSKANYKSVTNKAPYTNVTFDVSSARAKNLGTGIYVTDFHMWWTVRMLYLVEFADWDANTKIGAGLGITTTGVTDSMQYCTGTMSSSRSSAGYIQYRNIEGLWGTPYNWMAGIRVTNYLAVIYPRPNNSGSAGTANLQTFGYYSDQVKNFIVPSQSGYDWALLPKERGSGYTKAIFQNRQFTNYDKIPYSGSGLFGLNAYYLSDGSNSSLGYRLQKLP